MAPKVSKVSEAYNKSKTAVKGKYEETGVSRLARERAAAAVARASQKTQEGVVKGLATLKVQTAGALDALSNQIASELATLSDVQEAIKAEETRLKAIHDITVEADALQALQLANQEERDAFELEKTTARKQWEDDRKLTLVTRQRNEEQYLYDLNKRHKEEEDKILEARLQRQHQFDTDLAQQTAQLKAREAAVAAQEAEIKALREQVAAFPEQLKKEVSREVAIVSNSLKRDHTHETALAKLTSDNLLNLKTTEVTQLTKRVEELVNQNKALDQQYKDSSSKVQQIAEKAIEGASRQQTVLQVAGNDGSGDQRRK